ncbi:MAG: cysteine desulfurase family protein [Sphingobium sp.]
MSHLPSPAGKQRIYLDHAATTPVCEAAREAMARGLERWANPSSPHAEGRAAREALEDARIRIKAALGWDGHVIFTSGASEAIAIALTRAKAEHIVTSPVEHDAVLRVTQEAQRLAIDALGCVSDTVPGALHVIQHVNNETGVIQPIAELAERIHEGGGWLFCDCAQSAAKLGLPLEADMIAVSAHKFGGPPGIGALLVRDLTLLEPSGGQEQGYRGGTENVPAVLAMAAALEQDKGWMTEAARLRLMLDDAIRASGGEVVADGAERIPTIASYRMPGVAARAQLIRFDMAGIAVSAGAACSSGTLKTSPVLKAMGWNDTAADEVIRVSFGPQTGEEDVRAFITLWCDMVAQKAA